MIRRMSAVFSALLIVSMFFGVAVYARYSYTSSASSVLIINNKTAYCSSTATGMSDVTKIAGTQYLQKKENRGSGWQWYTVSNGTWTKTVNDNLIDMSNSKSGLTSGTYRLKTVFTVYSGKKSESVEKISSEVTI